MHGRPRRSIVLRNLGQRPVAAQVEVENAPLVFGQQRAIALEQGKKAASGLKPVKGHALTGYQTHNWHVLTAVILVKSTREALTHLGPQLADVAGVAEVYTVTGEWDFVAIVRVREHDELASVVTQRLTRLEGIERTQTMVAFQQFSAHDLEAMFGLGMEEKKS